MERDRNKADEDNSRHSESTQQSNKTEDKSSASVKFRRGRAHSEDNVLLVAPDKAGSDSKRTPTKRGRRRTLAVMKSYSILNDSEEIASSKTCSIQ